MKSLLLVSIIEKLRHEETRWDAILELKLLQDPNDIPFLIELLSDPDWIVRWSVAEKLGDFRDSKALSPLANLLTDEDPHVRKNAIKALIRYGDRALPLIVFQLENKDPSIRKAICDMIKGLKENSITAIEKTIFAQNAIVASRLLHLIWELGGPVAEKSLIRLLDQPSLQKQIIILLGALKTRLALSKLLLLYKNPKLKRVILLTFKQIDPEYFFEFIINASLNGKDEQKAIAKEVINKIGKYALPYYAKALNHNANSIPIIVDAMLGLGIEDALIVLKKAKISDAKSIKQIRKMLESKPEVREILGIKDKGFFGIFQ